ncbi:GyrI-like domain-containing protein [Lacticaseibacillus parakribbianus]|uniref:GyrI-like domain-containing protein n=1 Tax=Lacticaseibacillus parakribbianus TaxID=2970927 RepID=UPI0021CB858B|nr:GyrI-like domain-containing protein [Lacticaseibacillus parakribbianus]
MTALLNQVPQKFIGKVYTVVDSDQMGTFYACWEEFAQNHWFDQLDALTPAPNRSYMVIFSPYGQFQYWIGSIVPDDAKAPVGFESFQMPAGTIGKTAAKASGVLNQLPVQTSFNKGLEMLEKAGFPIPQHIGQTSHPYYFERYDLTNGAVSDVQYILYINEDELEGYDEFD